MNAAWWVVGCSITRKTHSIQSLCQNVQTFISQSCQFWSSGTWPRRRPSPSVVMPTGYVISLYKKLLLLLSLCPPAKKRVVNNLFLNDKILNYHSHLCEEEKCVTSWVYKGMLSTFIIAWSYTHRSVKWWIIIIKGWITVITVLLQRQIRARENKGQKAVRTTSC